MKQPVTKQLSEYEECKMLAQYLRLRKLIFTHIPNETRTPSMAQKMKNKMMGVTSGVPDYMIVIQKPSGNKLVFVEMKRKKGGVISENQTARLNILESTGCIVGVCNGFKEAFDFIESILKSP